MVTASAKQNIGVYSGCEEEIFKLTKQDKILFTLRLPKKMYKQLQDDAIITGISINAQICSIIRNYYDQKEAIDMSLTERPVNLAEKYDYSYLD